MSWEKASLQAAAIQGSEVGESEGGKMKNTQDKQDAVRIFWDAKPCDSDTSSLEPGGIRYYDKQFDMAYCSHVIEHVEHPRLLLREIKRVSEFQVFEIPLDYSIGVDENVEHFLSYGHINIFTPSLFKFLLKSEGYEIIDEVFTHTHREVIRFNWYKNMKLERSLKRDLLLHLYPFRSLLRRIKLGNNRYREFGYSAYTCFARGAGELKIF